MDENKMTREQAAEILKDMAFTATHTFRMALDIAIKVLLEEDNSKEQQA